MRVRLLWLWCLAFLLAFGLFGGAVTSVFADGEDTYLVANGEALENIAARFGTTVEELARLNGLANPNRIRVGQELRVPSRAASGGYVVVDGDTLEGIAYAHDLSVADLKAANQLPDPDVLAVGQQLVIPTGRSGAPRGGEPLEVAPSPYLQVPYRSQFDGTTYADSNCGPATLGMLMAYYDEWWSSSGIRRDVNRYSGDWSVDGGSDWESLVSAARKRDFTVLGLYSGNSYRRWSFDDLMAEVRNGHPPMLLVRFRALPGHERSSWWGDHYIVFLGLTEDGRVAYHDAAFYGGIGAYRTMSKDQLMRAWSTNAVGIQYSGLVLRWSSNGE